MLFCMCIQYVWWVWVCIVCMCACCLCMWGCTWQRKTGCHSHCFLPFKDRVSCYSLLHKLGFWAHKLLQILLFASYFDAVVLRLQITVCWLALCGYWRHDLTTSSIHCYLPNLHLASPLTMDNNSQKRLNLNNNANQRNGHPMCK